jgi:hypothetical protein
MIFMDHGYGCFEIKGRHARNVSNDLRLGKVGLYDWVG